jgi:hypothetical protein
LRCAGAAIFRCTQSERRSSWLRLSIRCPLSVNLTASFGDGDDFYGPLDVAGFTVHFAPLEIAIVITLAREFDGDLLQLMPLRAAMRKTLRIEKLIPIWI